MTRMADHLIGCPYAAEDTMYLECPRLVHGLTGEPCEGCLSTDATVPAIDTGALVELVAALQPGVQWHGKGGASRQRLRIVRMGAGTRVPHVTFERTAGVDARALGREVTCGLDQLLAAFVPDPRAPAYAHLSDAEYSVALPLVENDREREALLQTIGYEFVAFLARIGKHLHEMTPVEGLDTDDYRAIAAACVAETFPTLMAIAAPEVDLG